MLVQPSRQRVEVEVGDERMNGRFRIKGCITLVFAVHLFTYLVAGAREWRQDHTAFEQANDRSIECDLQVDAVRISPGSVKKREGELMSYTRDIAVEECVTLCTLARRLQKSYFVDTLTAKAWADVLVVRWQHFGKWYVSKRWC